MTRAMDGAVMEKRLSGKPNNLLLIIPYNSEYRDLQSHVRALSRQDFAGFDLMVVAERGADVRKAVALLRGRGLRFGTMLARRLENTGSAGAYFLGQKFALENGYSCVICADADCMPEDKSLVRALYSRRGEGFVSATMHAVIGKERVRLDDPSVNHYTLFSREAMERFGLYYAPLFYYAEDGEYRERVRIRRSFVPQSVTHPFKIEGGVLRQGRGWYVQLNSIHFLRRPALFFRSLLLFLFLASVGCVFLRGGLSRMARLSLFLLLSYSYGRPALERLMAEDARLKWRRQLPAGPAFAEVAFADGGYASSGAARKAARLALSFFDNFRKDVAIGKSYSLSKAFCTCMVAKRAYARRESGEVLELCDNSGRLLHAARLLLFLPAFAALLAFAGIPYLLVKAVRQPDTAGYGLELR